MIKFEKALLLPYMDQKCYFIRINHKDSEEKMQLLVKFFPNYFHFNKNGYIKFKEFNSSDESYISDLDYVCIFPQNNGNKVRVNLISQEEFESNYIWVAS